MKAERHEEFNRGWVLLCTFDEMRWIRLRGVSIVSVDSEMRGDQGCNTGYTRRLASRRASMSRPLNAPVRVDEE